MATGTSLIVDFMDAEGTKRSISWANIDPESPTSSIKSFVEGVVSNSANILKTALVSASTAILRTTTDTNVDLS